MKRIPRSLISISAGIITSALLFALMWRQVGSLYAPGIDEDFADFGAFELFNLFLSDLLPLTLLMAFTTGIVTGAIKSDGRLCNPIYRSAIASVLFADAVFMYFSYTFGYERTAHISDITVTVWLVRMLGSIGAYLIVLPLVTLFSTPIWLAAPVGAVVGNTLNQRKHALYALILIMMTSTVIFTFYQGCRVSSAQDRVERNMPLIESAIRQNLIPLTHYVWKKKMDIALPLHTGNALSPSVYSLSCDIPAGGMWITLTKQGAIKEASVYLDKPKDKALRTKAEIQRYILSTGVKESVANKLHRGTQWWEASDGKYHVVLYD